MSTNQVVPEGVLPPIGVDPDHIVPIDGKKSVRLAPEMVRAIHSHHIENRASAALCRDMVNEVWNLQPPISDVTCQFVYQFRTHLNVPIPQSNERIEILGGLHPYGCPDQAGKYLPDNFRASQAQKVADRKKNQSSTKKTQHAEKAAYKAWLATHKRKAFAQLTAEFSLEPQFADNGAPFVVVPLSDVSRILMTIRERGFKPKDFSIQVMGEFVKVNCMAPPDEVTEPEGVHVPIEHEIHRLDDDGAPHPVMVVTSEITDAFNMHELPNTVVVDEPIGYTITPEELLAAAEPDERPIEAVIEAVNDGAEEYAQQLAEQIADIEAVCEPFPDPNTHCAHNVGLVEYCAECVRLVRESEPEPDPELLNPKLQDSVTLVTDPEAPAEYEAVKKQSQAPAKKVKRFKQSSKKSKK